MSSKGYQIGVDLGTKNTLVYVKGLGIIFNEPTVIAIDKETNKVIAVGHEAYDMLGKEHQKIKVIEPLEGGVIADLDATKAILSYILENFKNRNDIDSKKTTLLICCPSEMTTTERTALEHLGIQLNIRDVFVEPEVIAGAIGSGLDIFASRGSMVIDIGGGSTDIGVLALGDLVLSDSVKIAGKYIDKEIIKYVKFKYGVIIGERTAENIKIGIGTLRNELIEEKEFTFAGRSLKNGLPVKASIKQSEIRVILRKAFETITLRVKKVLQDTPPELSADILEDGIVVNGGGALIDGIKAYFEDALGIKISISENPLTSIAEGTKFLLQNRGNYLVKPAD